MANPQPDKFTRIANELYEAIMQSDFSKRQRNIIDLVIRMSYGCGKKHAILRPSDFELCGVGKNHVKAELQYLSAAKVLFIDGEVIRLNKNYDQWRVSIVKGFNPEKFSQVLKRNLIVPESGTKVPETGTPDEEESSQNGNSLPDESSQNGNSGVPKTGTATFEKCDNGAASGPPKEILKKYIAAVSKITESKIEDPAADAADDLKAAEDDDWLSDDLTEEQMAEMKAVTDHWRRKRAILVIPPADLEAMEELVKKGIPAADIIKGIDKTFADFAERNRSKPWKKINSFRYCLQTIYEIHQARTTGGNVRPFPGRSPEPARPNVIDEGALEKYRAMMERAKRKTQTGG